MWKPGIKILDNNFKHFTSGSSQMTNSNLICEIVIFVYITEQNDDVMPLP